MIHINTNFTADFYTPTEWEALLPEGEKALNTLYEGTGAGNEFLGWLNLPGNVTTDTLQEIQSQAAKLQKISDYVVIIGIGGSYLGARAVIEALSNSISHKKEGADYPQILYAGHQLSGDYLHELVHFLRDKRFSLISISKSGTTTEPAIAFRILKNLLENQVGKDGLSERIVAVTDANKGALRMLTNELELPSYVIPDNVGGRFSVFTPVGLLPIAAAGFDIAELIRGAREMEANLFNHRSVESNPALHYALTRNLLYRKGFTNEVMISYHPKLAYLSEWWKQLYGESEGKDGKGIFPASVQFTTDLHSMGQYLQDGKRNLFETILRVKQGNYSPEIPMGADDFDQLNYLAGKSLDWVNEMADKGTLLAHLDGGVPPIQIEIDRLDEFHLGQLLFFYEVACGISAYLLGVNPFDQPGVEAYKKNMFALLGKPGFEKENQALKARLG